MHLVAYFHTNKNSYYLIYPEHTVINKQFAGMTLVVTKFITGELSGEIQETLFNIR